MRRLSDRVAVFLHSGDYDRVHQGLSIAAAAAALGRQADVFLFWWALERVGADALDEPDFSPNREDVADRLETQRAPSLRELFRHARDSRLCTVYGCTGSAGALGIKPPAAEGLIDQWVGWTTILKLTAGVVDRFYL